MPVAGCRLPVVSGRLSAAGCQWAIVSLAGGSAGFQTREAGRILDPRFKAGERKVDLLSSVPQCGVSAEQTVLQQKFSWGKRRTTVTRQEQNRRWNFGTNPRAAAAAVALTMLLVLSIVATPAAQAQTFTVIHNFSGGGDGATPMAGLVMDRGGNFYGTAAFGGNMGGNCGAGGCGVVFRLSNHSGWVLSPLYSFLGGNDAANPEGNVAIGADGSLYLTVRQGGGVCNGSGCGAVVSLKPPLSACKSALCSWAETVLHRFTGEDGANPVGAVVFDQSGNLYGATTNGGFDNGGTVFELTASSGWMERILRNAYGYPNSGPIFDPGGNLYGTTFIGGNGQGSVYQLTPSGSGWLEQDLYAFNAGSDGGFPWAGLIFDPAGNLYGATTAGGPGQGGTVFELTRSGDSWTLTTLYSFKGPGSGRLVVGPVGSLVMDQTGSLYGTTFADGAYGFGAVFKLTPGSGGWSYTALHDFTGGSDGGNPYSNLVLDANGNLYGAASIGGGGPCLNGCGVLFQIKQ
jgi:uncharacterized repeat protein (TIGR03803 family)